MAKATFTIEDRIDGVGVHYALQLEPVPKTKEELTMAQNMGLTAFDAIESILKKYGAQIKQGEINAQTPGRK